MPQAFLLLVGFFSAGLFSAGFLVAADYFPTKGFFRLIIPTAYFPFFPTTGMLSQTPLSSDLASSSAAALSTWGLWFLAW